MNKERIAIISIAILILLFSAIAAAYVLSGHVEFDEGFNLQIPASLLNKGSYSTTYDGGKDFDPVITTGPTVLLPIYILFRVFNIGLYQARFVMLFYFIGMLLATLYVSKKLNGAAGSIISLILLGSIPFIFYFGLRVLGEIPAVFFLLIGLIFLERGRAIVSGIFFGLSVLTKITFLIAVFPIALLFVLEFSSSSLNHRKFVVRYYLLMVLGFVLPNVGWEMVKVISLGIAGYEKNLQGLLNLFISSSGVRNTAASASFLVRIDTLSIHFTYIPPFLLLIILLLILLHNANLVRKSYRKNGWSGLSRMHLFLAAFSFAFLFWWLFGANAGWWRHILPGYILIIILIGNSLASLIKSIYKYFREKSTERNLSSTLIWSTGVVIALFGFLLIVIEPVYAQSQEIKNQINRDLLKNQVELADEISNISNNGGLIGYWGWWQSPEISFLSQSDFFDIEKSETVADFDRSSREGNDVYVLIAPTQRVLVPEVWNQERFYCGELIHEKNDYQLFEYIPSEDTISQLQYIQKRGDSLESSTYTFGPEGETDSYTSIGIYRDGWMAERASVWFKKEDTQKNLVIKGQVNLDFFDSKEILVRIYVMDSFVQEKVIKNTGNFQWLIGVPDAYRKSDVLKVTITADHIFVPLELGINSDPRELSLMIKEISLQ